MIIIVCACKLRAVTAHYTLREPLHRFWVWGSDDNRMNLWEVQRTTYGFTMPETLAHTVTALHLYEMQHNVRQLNTRDSCAMVHLPNVFN